MSAMMPGMIRNHIQANGVASSATRTVTSSARGSVFDGFLGETMATEIMTTTAWMTQRSARMPRELMCQS